MWLQRFFLNLFFIFMLPYSITMLPFKHTHKKKQGPIKTILSFIGLKIT